MADEATQDNQGSQDGRDGQTGAAGGAGADGGQQPQTTVVLDDSNFQKFIPAELAEHAPMFQNFKGLGDVFKSYVNAQKMVGGEKIVIPKGTLDTPEAWADVFKKLGVPDTPEGYGIKKPDGYPADIPYDEKLDKDFAAFAHKAGLLPKQVAAIHGWHADVVKGMYESTAGANRQALEQGIASLKKEWGADYDKRLDLANRVVKTFGGSPEEVGAFLKAHGNSPVMARVMNAVGGMISEEKLVAGHKGGGGGAGNASAKSAATDIMTNKDNPWNAAYWDKGHIRHNEAVQTVERLMVAAAGNKGVRE